MRTYIRARVPGASYFFTLTLQDRRSSLLIEHVDTLRKAFQAVRRTHPFTMEAVSVLPDHLHCIWTLPEEDTDYSTRWSLIKASFSRAVPQREQVGASRIRRRERGIWQRRYWEHVIRDEAEYARIFDYIHYNPVKHGHAASCASWRHSSFRKYVEAGLYTEDWAASPETSAIDWD